MARLKLEDSKRLEMLEGDLALLGNARVYLEMVFDRVKDGAVLQPELLIPAMQDMQQMDLLLRKVQKRLTERTMKE